MDTSDLLDRELFSIEQDLRDIEEDCFIGKLSGKQLALTIFDVAEKVKALQKN